MIEEKIDTQEKDSLWQYEECEELILEILGLATHTAEELSNLPKCNESELRNYASSYLNKVFQLQSKLKALPNVSKTIVIDQTNKK
jgi:hypothetical protein